MDNVNATFDDSHTCMTSTTAQRAAALGNRRRGGACRLAGMAVLAAWLHVSAWAAEPLTLAVSRGPVSLTVWVAETNGYFEREGLTVRVRDCSSGRSCVEMLDAGADLATAAELVVTLGSFSRADLAIIATISASSHQIKLIARRSAGVTVPSQLRGKRVGTVLGTSAEFFLDSWLLFHGLSAGDISLVALGPDQLAGALARGEVDAIAIWEPHAATALKSLGTDGLSMPNPRVYTQFFSLVTTRGAIARRSDEMQRLLRALLRSQQFIADEPSRAREILVNRLGMEPGSADAQFREHDFRIRLDEALIGAMGRQARWAVREGHVKPEGKIPNPLNLVEPSLLRQGAPGAITLAH